MLIPASAGAGAGASPVPATYALSIGSQADQLGLTGTQFPEATATKDGASIVITGYAWTVTGPCTLDNAAIAQPTPTGTGAGTCTRKLVATLADGATVTETDDWRVGDTDGWLLLWTAIPSQMADTDWQSAPNYTTHDTVIMARYLTGTFDALAVASGVLTINTAAGTDGGIFCRALEAVRGQDGKRVAGTIAIVIGMDASLTANGDGFGVHYINQAFSKSVRVHARRSGGAQQVGAGDETAMTYVSAAGGSQARQLVLYSGPQRLVARGAYTADAWSGTGKSPAASGWTKIAATPSGWYQVCETVTEASVSDLFAPDATTDVTCDHIALFVEGDNGRTYLPAGIAVWFKL